MHARWIVAGAILCLTATAPVIAEPSLTERAPAPARRQLVYAEALGKGGPYGIGWELAITRRLAIGAVGSVAVVRGQQLYTFAPYLHLALLGERRHAMFGEAGLAIAHSRLVSPVPEWDGMSDTGGGGHAVLGYEYRRGRIVGRVYGALAVGSGGVAPFGGLAVGVRL